MKKIVFFTIGLVTILGLLLVARDFSKAEISADNGTPNPYSDAPYKAFLPGVVAIRPMSPSASSYDIIINSSFENNTGWDIPATEYSAGYSTKRPFTGARSMRTGIVNSSDNTYSYSDARQKVTIPKSSTSATLSLWIYQISSESASLPLPELVQEPVFGKTALSSDLQYVLILDKYQNWIDTLIWQRSNKQAWVNYEFDLTDYAGKTIYLQFGSYNDGAGGVTSMFVDDFSLWVSPPPTAATSTPPAPSVTCSEEVVNGSFEKGSGWELTPTEYTAAYSTKRFVSGLRSLRTGIVNESDNRYSYSSARQEVFIPRRQQSATLGFWIYPISSQTSLAPLPKIEEGTVWGKAPLSSDLQYVILLDANEVWIDTLIWQRTNDRTWEYYEFDLLDYAGQTIYLEFGSYNDGFDGITSMFVDDVSLEICPRAPTSTPGPTSTSTITPIPTNTPLPTQTPTVTNTPLPSSTPTPLPAGCYERIRNPGFENNTGWDIPLTEYSASYSAKQVFSGLRSMRTGIVNSSDNTFSYSDARQQVTIPSNALSATLNLWIYPQSSVSSLAPLPAIQQGIRWGALAPASDVQYLLILDENEIWIDTLIWQRRNTRAWTNFQFNLRPYRGQTIYLQFGTYNDGLDGVTSMYVDDFSLVICRP